MRRAMFLASPEDGGNKGRVTCRYFTLLQARPTYLCSRHYALVPYYLRLLALDPVKKRKMESEVGKEKWVVPYKSDLFGYSR